MTATVHETFEAIAARYPNRPMLCVVRETARIYGIEAGETTYAEARHAIEQLRGHYAEAGYGPGHRVGLLVENRPAFLWNWLALNALGASIVPINPDLRAAELAYLIEHSEMVLAVAIPARAGDLREAAGEAGRDLAVIAPDGAPPPAPFPATRETRAADIEAAVLYTSGTTGAPKGCVLTNTYFTHCGEWYRGMGGLCALGAGTERMLTPLPLFHMNALACSVMAMLATGGCLTVLDRFHPRSWWDSVRESGATCIHYLGVMPPMLMGSPEGEADRDHAVRFGFGAGVPTDLHAPFESRFGFPLIEAWAMTETGAGGVITAHEEPRHVGTACFGRTDEGVEARVVAEDGTEAGPNEPGELLVRRAGPDPRHGFFDRYLKDEAATDAAWQGGWLHTGDVVRRDAAGNFRFVDRKKNVIRRSGENIAAVEVEGVLRGHPLINDAGVAPVPDDVRGDEVFALVVPAGPLDDPAAAAAEINAWMLTRLAYYKAPGFIAFVDALPVTATNKVQRQRLKDEAARLLAEGAAIDLRATKKRAA